jgi:hypothetical protein
MGTPKMTGRDTELYHPRETSNRGIYDLLADGRTVSDEMIKTAESFLRGDVLIAAQKMGDSNGLGFVIIHSADLGITIAAHCWTQG